MTDPRPCDECGRMLDHDRLVHEVLIDAHTEAPDFRRRLCPACARRHRTARRFGQVEDWARETARRLLERTWGEHLAVYWLQQGDHGWAILCRRRRRHRTRGDRP